MADIVDRQTRSRMMAGIRGRDTAPEVAVRSHLHRSGLRFRLHVGTLPGRPDIVLAKYRTVVFVHGCFWHRHAGCRFAYTPKTRRRFWLRKFSENVERDQAAIRSLRKDDWRVIVIWECQIQAARLDWLRAQIVATSRSQHRGKPR